MYCIQFSEGEELRCADNNYVRLVPRDITDSCEVVLEKVAAGRATPPNAPGTFQQIYIVLAGEGEITMGGKTRRVSAPAATATVWTWSSTRPEFRRRSS